MNAQNKHILLCEDSLEGIFTGVYNAYEQDYGHDHTALEISSQLYSTQLFCEYHETPADLEKARKVLRTINKKISYYLGYLLSTASLSYDSRKADAIYRAIILGLSMGQDVVHHRSDQNISLIHKLVKNVENEIMHLRGFTRFEELQNDVLFARINPKNDILRPLSDHFADRFPEEFFIIADTTRNSYFLHSPEESHFVLHSNDNLLSTLESQIIEEGLYQELWKNFIESITITQRTNVQLQTQMLPLRFRTYMTEF